MLNILKIVFGGLLILSIPWIFIVSQNQETFNNPKFALTGLGVLLGSIFSLFVITKVEIHYWKNKVIYDKFRTKFILIGIIIFVGVINLSFGFIDLTQNHLTHKNLAFILIGGAIACLGYIRFRGKLKEEQY